KEGHRVAVALLPPANFRGITSEGMFLGAGEGVLKDVKGEIGGLPKGIPLEALKETRNLVESFLKS
ncbi:MAG: tRNA-binding protein, partial [Thermococcus sp.]|nr:tRNA-binding protein [Thermococcus sp.]